jgi:hypothetical protein
VRERGFKAGEANGSRLARAEAGGVAAHATLRVAAGSGQFADAQHLEHPITTAVAPDVVGLIDGAPVGGVGAGANDAHVGRCRAGRADARHNKCANHGAAHHALTLLLTVPDLWS